MDLSALRVALLVITFVINIVLALFVLRSNPKSRTNQIYAALSFIISIWLLILYLSQSTRDSGSFLIWARLSIFFAVPLSVTFFLFAHTIPSSNFKLSERKLWTIFILTLVTMIVAVSPVSFTGVEVNNGSFETISGPGMALFGNISTIFSAASVYVLFKRFRKSIGVEREQFKLVMYGILIMLGLVTFTILLPVVIIRYHNFVVLSPLYTLIFLGITAYAIVRHKFLDIRLLVARTVSYTVIIFTVVSSYVFLLFVVTSLLPGFELNINQIFAVSFISVVLFFTASPLQRTIERLTDDVFFKGRYNTEEVITKLTKTMASVIDIKLLSDHLLTTLITEMRITKGAFLISGEHKLINIESVGFDEGNLRSRPDIEKLLHTRESSYIYEEMPDDERKGLLRSLDISAVFPLRVKEKEIGLLVIGPKASGDIYNTQDIELLEIFAPQAAIALQNAESYLEIQEFTRTLEHKVEERTKELTEAQERELAKARELLKLKDEFVFIATHDLRTPVTAIKGFISLLEDDIAKLPESMKEDFSAIQDASNRLNQLVDDLLEVARSESGTIKIEVEPIDFNKIVDETIKEVEPKAKERGITITKNISSANSNVMADGEKLKEVMENLLSNAVKYNKDNGNVTVTTEEQSGKLWIGVKDTGIGIPKDQQDKVFQKFFRARTKGTEAITGTGLGLFVVRMLIEKMNGKIDFESEEGIGTEFVFTLPLASGLN